MPGGDDRTVPFRRLLLDADALNVADDGLLRNVVGVGVIANVVNVVTS